VTEAVTAGAEDDAPGLVAESSAGGGDGRHLLRGALTFATARAVHEQGRRVILAASAGDAALEFDCRGLTQTDSAGVAVLINWLALAKRRGRRLKYFGISEGVRAIARISEVDELLESGV
jgi:phospholipid transport system transporter-binding protein